MREHSQNIATKLRAAWGSTVGTLGYADPYEVAARAHDALYQPEYVLQGIDDRAPTRAAEGELPSRQLRDDTRETLLQPLDFIHPDHPDPEDFVRAVAGAVLHCTSGVDRLGARELIQYLIDRGDRPVIWSSGHVEHQHRKLGRLGLYDPAAERAFDPPIHIHTDQGEPMATATVIAPDKTTDQTFAQVRDLAESHTVAVVDDRVENLRLFRRAISGAKVAIWAQHGTHAAREMEKLEQGNNPQLREDMDRGHIIRSRGPDEVKAVLDLLRRDGRLRGTAAVFIDLDDTLSVNKWRRNAELNAALDVIFRRRWA
jgi:hypothetical protein